MGLSHLFFSLRMHFDFWWSTGFGVEFFGRIQSWIPISFINNRFIRIWRSFDDSCGSFCVDVIVQRLLQLTEKTNECSLIPVWVCRPSFVGPKHFLAKVNWSWRRLAVELGGRKGQYWHRGTTRFSPTACSTQNPQALEIEPESIDLKYSFTKRPMQMDVHSAESFV